MYNNTVAATIANSLRSSNKKIIIMFFSHCTHTCTTHHAYNHTLAEHRPHDIYTWQCGDSDVWFLVEWLYKLCGAVVEYQAQSGGL